MRLPLEARLALRAAAAEWKAVGKAVVEGAAAGASEVKAATLAGESRE